MSYRRSQRNGKIIRYESKPRDATITKATEEASIDDIYTQLKRDVKRSSIIARLQQKQNTGATRTRHTSENKRHPNEQLSKAEGLRQLRKIYEREQQTIGDMLHEQQRKQQMPKQQRNEPAKIKQGLLGEFKYYERMDKPQLIEKLIALEYLTQKLYKRNKYLEQQLDPKKQEGMTPTSLNHTFY